MANLRSIAWAKRAATSLIRLERMLELSCYLHMTSLQTVPRRSRVKHGAFDGDAGLETSAEQSATETETASSSPAMSAVDEDAGMPSLSML